MLRTITSLVWNTLPYRRGIAASLALRSQLRHLTSLPRQNDWDNLLNGCAKVEDVLTKEEKPIGDLWEEQSVEYQTRRNDQKIPLFTYSGRQVPVKSGNVAEAYGRLQSILGRNKVQAQLRLTERHEKKGVKRRRLSSERWRKQFAHEVRQKVQLVAKIRSRGA